MVKIDYVADLLRIFSVFALCNLKLCEVSLGIAEFRFVAVAFSPKQIQGNLSLWDSIYAYKTAHYVKTLC